MTQNSQKVVDIKILIQYRIFQGIDSFRHCRNWVKIRNRSKILLICLTNIRHTSPFVNLSCPFVTV